MTLAILKAAPTAAGPSNDHTPKDIEELASKVATLGDKLRRALVELAAALDGFDGGLSAAEAHYMARAALGLEWAIEAAVGEITGPVG